MLKGIRKLDMNSIILSTPNSMTELVAIYFMEFVLSTIKTNY